MSRPVVRLNCAYCRRFLLKAAMPEGESVIPLLVVPCAGCNRSSYFMISGDDIFYMSRPARDPIEPKSDLSVGQLDTIISLSSNVKVTVSCLTITSQTLY